MKYFPVVIVLTACVAAVAAINQMKESSPVSEKHPTYSVALRVQRVTYEDAYVAVPVTDAITKTNSDGTIGIDFEKFTAEAIRISKDTNLEWRIEEAKTEPHPIQRPAPEDRKALDPAVYQTKK